MITGHTKLYGIVANPIAHVKTPEEVNKHFAALGHDGVLVPFHVLPENLAQFVNSLRKLENLGGLVVTVHTRRQFSPFVTGWKAMPPLLGLPTSSGARVMACLSVSCWTARGL